MGFLKIGENIVKYRKEKGITQEALAEFVGVSKASVSKWETSSTTPDIQMLPVLAAFFDKSVDELMGYEAQLSEKQIRYYYHDLKKKFARDGYSAVWKESQRLVKEYYSCYQFLMQMAILWLNHVNLAKNLEEKNGTLAFIEMLCNRILENSRESGLCENARLLLAMVWIQQGRQREVIDSMEKEVLDVNRAGDKSDLLVLAYMSNGENEKAHYCAKIALYRNLVELLSQLTSLLISAVGDGNAGKTANYIEKIIKRGSEIIECFQVESLQPNAAAGFFYQASVALACVKADEGKIYKQLEKYVHAIENLYKDGIKLHADTFFAELEGWFEKLEIGPESVRDGKVILKDAIASLKHPAFAGLSNMREMKQLERRLRGLEEA